MTRATWRQNNLKPITTLEIKTQPSASLCRQRIDTCNFQIIDVQKKIIRDQNFMILDLNEKIRETGNDSHDSKNVSRSFSKQGTIKAPVNNSNSENNVSKRFSDLYLKAAVTKDDNDDYESVIDDDDNDSFITIESDAESDVTLGHGQSSSDSGYTDIAEAPGVSSYGVNPMFARHSGSQADGTESCEDFVFFNSGKGQIKNVFHKQQT